MHPDRKPESTEGHEGAVDGLPPGTPTERDVIKPDWANLEEVAQPPTEPDAEQGQQGRRHPAKPMIDRHR